MINHNQPLSTLDSKNYAPFVTCEKYAELTGFSLNAVKNMCDLGKLPVLKRESGKRGRILINMRALEEYAQEQALSNEHWKAAI
ncbi:helix-turn-helix domain-containing protein [Vibrio nigripulchritudo]|uniref:helix-turn-helix domain-containing protein n=1 Tax=Vibrio nigripulchritudo TaxID=28173 RepID=UPI0005F9B061|nr:helix-turn-helix domain-containing protein [Vibrio nigripulchritudo]KJY81205.1 hypothetical protein TW74_02665 [Vibrio nigripulchritudo]